MSGGTIRELITKLGFDIDDEKLDLFEKRVDKVKTGLIAMTAVGAATVAGLVAITKSAANVGDDLDAQADLFGVAVEQLQIWTRAAALGDIGAEEFTSSLQYLNRNLGDAARDAKGPAAKVFKTLGINLNDTAGHARKTGDVLNELSGKFATISDPAKRASLAMDLFGRGGQRMGRFLAQSSEDIARATEVVTAFGFFTAETAAMGDSANDTWEDTLTLFKGIKDEIGIGLMPLMKNLLERLNRFILANKDLIKAKIQTFITKTTAAGYALLRVFKAIAEPAVVLVKALGGLENTVKLLGVALLSLGGTAVVGTISALISLVAALGLSIGAVLLEVVGIPLLIAAGIGALILVFEDIYGWINGSDSLIGTWLGSWVAFKEGALREFKDVLEGLGVIVDGIKETFAGLWEVLSGAFGIVVALWRGDLEGFKASFKKWATGVADILTGPLLIAFGLIETAFAGVVKLFEGALKIAVALGKVLIPPSVMKLAEFLHEKAAQGVHAVAGVLDGPQASLAGIPGGGGGASTLPGIMRPTASAGGTTNKIEVNATVNAPPGTSEQQAAFLKSSMEEVAGEVLGRHIGHVMQNNPRRE